MTDPILSILGSVGLTYLWACSEPALWLRQRLGLHVCSRRSLFSFLARLSECCLCAGWWVGLATGLGCGLGWASMLHGAAVSVLAELTHRRLQRF